MKPKQLIRLVLILAVLGLVAYFVKGRERNSRGSKMAAVKDREKVFPDLPINDIAFISVNDGKATVDLVKPAEGKWAVANRDNFPADYQKIASLVSTLRDLKVVQGVPAGESQLGRLGLLPPGQGEEGQSGTEVTLKNGSGETLTSLLLGGSASRVGGAGGASTKQGRFVKTASDTDTVWHVSERFSEVTSSAKDWLDSDFIEVSNLKQVSLTQPDASQSWEVTREADGTPWAFPGGGEETPDPSKVSDLNFLFNTASFEDLVSSADAKTLDFSSGQKAKLVSFDGFTYDLQLLKVEEEGAEGAPPEAKHYMKVAVTGSFPTEYVPAPSEDNGETSEESTAEDSEANEPAEDPLKLAFENQLAANQKKLAFESGFADRVFEVSEYSLNALMKTRADLLPTPGDEAAAAAGGAAGGAPSGIPGLSTDFPAGIRPYAPTGGGTIETPEQPAGPAGKSLAPVSDPSAEAPTMGNKKRDPNIPKTKSPPQLEDAAAAADKKPANLSSIKDAATEAIGANKDALSEAIKEGTE